MNNNQLYTMDQSISDSDNSGYESDTDMYMDPIDGWRALQCSKPSERKYMLYEYSDSESDTEFDIDMSEYDSDSKPIDIIEEYESYDSNALEEAGRELRTGISRNLESLIHSHDIKFNIKRNMKPSLLVSTKHNSLYNYLNQMTEDNYGMITVGAFYDQYVKYNADPAITLSKVALGRMLNKYGITTIRHRLGNLYHINKDVIDAWNIAFIANAHV
jgi:hypothetical protein